MDSQNVFTGESSGSRIGRKRKLSPRENPKPSPEPTVLSPPQQKNETIVRPYVHGNYTRRIPENNKGHKFEFIVFLRSLDNDDMSGFIGSVNFQLNENYSPDQWTVYEPPYDITRTGNEEFAIKMTVYFKRKTIRPVKFFHKLKFPSDPLRNVGISEVYGEFVWENPSDYMRKCLERKNPLVAPYWFRTNFKEEREKRREELKNAYIEVMEELQKVMNAMEQFIEHTEMLLVLAEA